ncbi:EF-P beta-lysylation protein EpmB [Permianibacter sp. IMCC34836]|uniref:EF-P beta-lysylation protein EpmB n=1 Tax=Permianibacter fluminis TaxID=2738515 RepID=UPI0015548E9E|nr:EF-P beta-lysylation protein EpmB [Permianibacter fluminis]NQD36562.1 EF-P beta-lysylation protein EpmB [Permianibacter fluminis]
MADILANLPPKGQIAAIPVQSDSPRDWRQTLKEAIESVEELMTAVQVPVSALPERLQAQTDFALRVPRPFVARMAKGDLNDPLLKQVLPAPEELQLSPGYSHDPLDEQDTEIPGLLHKYRSRVLLITTGACAINCRYCFRRHFPYEDNRPGRKGFAAICDYIRQHPEVNEVILSGGDPLAAPDSYLAELHSQLAALPQLRRFRIHTRLPVVIPERVNDELLAWLASPRFQTVVVIHSNHGNEIDAEVGAALTRLRQAGVTLLNQAVLLAGVNDSVAALSELSERLFRYGVLPYYLNQLDQVQGASHFAVPDERARALMRELLTVLPGFLMPKLMREQAGKTSKTPLDLRLD